jgi:hypothetical protein
MAKLTTVNMDVSLATGMPSHFTWENPAALDILASYFETQVLHIATRR